MIRRYLCKGILCAVFLLVHALGLGQHPLVLKDMEKIYMVDSSRFTQVALTEDEKFVEVPARKTLYFSNPDPKKSFWYKFDILNNSSETDEWLLVSYNYHIGEIDVWTKDHNGHTEKQSFRDTLGVFDRKFVHKQPVFLVPLEPGQKKTVYVRVKNEDAYEYAFAFFSHYSFLAHFFKEYLWYGIFYGFMLFVLLYGLTNAIFFKDGVMLLYTGFIASQILHMLYRDGTGIFIFPGGTEYSDLLRVSSRCISTVALLVYAVAFLKISRRSRLFKVIVALIVIRIAAFILLKDTGKVSYDLEMFAIVFCTVLSIRSFAKGHTEAKYMSTGLSLLSVSYFFYYLFIMGVSSLSVPGFFGLYFGVAGESIFMTIAMTERFKRIRLDNFRKEQMNKELETLVQERTETIRVQNKLLEDQSKELNLFLYSASHDLKGPLKTILGLCNMGIMDKEADHRKIYDLIKNKLRNLEANLNDLNLVTNLKNADGFNAQIDFKALHEDMLMRFEEFPGFREIDIKLHLDLKNYFIADIFPIRCIYQNIFENAIKFRDDTKVSFLRISIEETGQGLVMTFEDNGEGIDKKHVPYIFNMFYRASEKSKEDTGLGLYIVKLAVLKLRGEISVDTTPGKGTKITVKLPSPSDHIVHSLFSLKNNFRPNGPVKDWHSIGLK